MFICWVSLSDKGSYFLGASLSFDFFGAPCTNRKPSSGTTWFSCWWKSLISLFWMWKTEGSSPAPVFYFVLKGLPHFQTPKFQSTGSLPQITDLGNACYYSMCTFSFKLAHVNWFATMKGEGLMFCTAASLNWHILLAVEPGWPPGGWQQCRFTAPLSVSVGCRSNWWISFTCPNFLWEAFWGHFALRSLCLNITSQSAVSLTHFLGDSSTLFLAFRSSFDDSPRYKERGNRWNTFCRIKLI